MSWLLAAVIAVAVAGVLVLTVALALLIPERRKRRQSRAPATLWRASVAPLPPAATPLESRPARALPAPEFHLHLYGPVTRDQLDELAALREAGYRAFDTYRREP